MFRMFRLRDETTFYSARCFILWSKHHSDLQTVSGVYGPIRGARELRWPLYLGIRYESATGPARRFVRGRNGHEPWYRLQNFENLLCSSV